jgi:hypothetical protein
MTVKQDLKALQKEFKALGKKTSGEKEGDEEKEMTEVWTYDALSCIQPPYIGCPIN